MNPCWPYRAVVLHNTISQTNAETTSGRVVAFDPKDKNRRTQTSYTSTDPRDLNGPPYGVAERVFDAYDIEACSLQREDS